MKIMSIAYNTFRESVRDRVLYVLVVFVLILIIASMIIGRIAVGQEAKFVVDVGLSAMTLFGAVIAIFIGIGLVSKEIEKQTIVTILSKPVRRSTLILGKYLGLCLTLLVNVVIMTGALTLALIYIKSSTEWPQWYLWSAAYLIYLELTLITAVAVLFSCFSTPAVSAIFTILIFIIGRWSTDLKLLAETSTSIIAGVFFRVIYYLLPNLANFNYINEAARGEAIETKIVQGNSLYAGLYIVSILAASVLIFERRSFK
jgi:ABC-type transport system involved in multi-copper enzyme maturation permease subunit